ncbi:MAG: energy transducer TonB [Acidobacteria bacterium]|nr:energy transducer TonB [Acidobacteriota bacterium]
MIRYLLCFILLLSGIFLDCPQTPAQSGKMRYESLLGEVCAREKERAACRPTGKRVSGFCYDFCPEMLALPDYPVEARRLRIYGTVTVEAVVDENGRVIDARAFGNLPFLHQAALRAVYRSRFIPQKGCDGRPVKFRGLIAYRFNRPD